MKNTAIRHISPDASASNGGRPKTSGDYGRNRESKSNDRLMSGNTGGGGLGGVNKNKS